MTFKTPDILAFRIIQLVFLGVLTYYVLSYQYLAWRWGKKSKYWPSVRGEITSAKVTNSWGSYLSYYPKVEYEYTVDNQCYKGKRIGFGIPFASIKSEAQNIIADYKIGKSVRVYYNPDNPKLATLETGVNGCFWVIGLVMSAICSSIFLAFAIGTALEILKSIGW